MTSFPDPKPIFVHEFVAGGGWAGEELPPGLLTEGYAMLQAVLADFRRWGRFPILTTLDARLSHPHPNGRAKRARGAKRRSGNRGARPAWRLLEEPKGPEGPKGGVEIVGPGQHKDLYPALVAQSQAVLVIAPETAGILQRLTATVEGLGVPLLGSSSDAVAVAGDKLACYRRFRRAGLPTPATRHARFGQDPEAAVGDLRYPLVIKPVDGVGCEGVMPVHCAADLPSALARLQTVTGRDDFLVTEYVSGTPASVSLLVTSAGARPLTLNRQHITLTDGSFTYRGGTVPLEHPLGQRAFAVAVQAVSVIPGLRGYVGVDLVLTDDEAFVIEVNPRLTTSYIGIRQVVDLNLAEAIWLACVRDELPHRVTTHGQVTFTKDELALNPISFR
jgi:predicted ATP-grasp superfamily ATP-dependent carboligase